MSSLKEFLNSRKQQEARSFRKAEGDQERAVSMAVEYTLIDMEKELESIQLEILYKLEANTKGMSNQDNDDWTRSYFYKINIGMMIVYRRLFGTEEYDKLMSGEGAFKGLDLNKIKDAIKEENK